MNKFFKWPFLLAYFFTLIFITLNGLVFAAPAENDQIRNAGDIEGVFMYCNNPAEGVHVYIPGSSFVAITGPSGDFKISYVPAGTYNIAFSKNGKKLETVSDVNVQKRSIVTIPTSNPCKDLDGDGYTPIAGDCDDANARVSPGLPEYCGDGLDNNCNGTAEENCPECVDNDSDLYFAQIGCGTPLDCDDGQSAINPGADESCDEVDNDCDGEIDEPSAVDTSTFYWDGDSDSFGVIDNSIQACVPPEGYVSTGGDCDDTNGLVNPSALEICNNNTDDDCDGTVDNLDCSTQVCTPAEIIIMEQCEGQCGPDPNCLTSCSIQDGGVSEQCFLAVFQLYGCANANNCQYEEYPDVCSYQNCLVEWEAVFGDIVPTECATGDIRDCGDTDLGRCEFGTQECGSNGLWGSCIGAVGPTEEVCNGVDDDCNGIADDNPSDGTTYYWDNDSDGFGVDWETIQACSEPQSFYASQAGDCNDDNSEVYPGQGNYFTETHDGFSYDYDCSGSEERESLDTWAANWNGTECVWISDGWYPAIPFCGASGEFYSGAMYNSDPNAPNCVPISVTVEIQACR